MIPQGSHGPSARDEATDPSDDALKLRAFAVLPKARRRTGRGGLDAKPKRWITPSDSSFDHEREALAFLRRVLPDSDPIRVWSNFEFITRTGAVYEVDALIVTSAGVFLV
jgi:hypothetical protein